MMWRFADRSVAAGMRHAEAAARHAAELEVPDHLRGRVMGIHTIGYSLGALGGLFLGGLADLVGAGWAVSAGAGIYLGAILFTGASRPAIRRLDGRALQSTTG